MSTRQVIEVSCDCKQTCPGPHRRGEPCPASRFVQTRSNAEARWVALVQLLWSTIPAPKGAYAVGDLCRECTDWADPEAVVRATLKACGFTAEPNLERALTEVRRLLDLPSTA